MDVGTMAALSSINMLNVAVAIQNAESIVVSFEKERQFEDMDGSMLDSYIGRDCVVSLFNEVGAIKGKLLDSDAQWVKVETPKKGTQLINRNMIRNLTFDK